MAESSDKWKDVVFRYDWCFIKRVKDSLGDYSYDLWKWNIFQNRWVRMSRTACGFGSLEDAKQAALDVSCEIETALSDNWGNPPLDPEI